MNYKNYFKQILSEAAPPVVPSEPGDIVAGTYNVMQGSEELVASKKGSGYSNTDKKTRFGTGLGLLNDADYEILRQKGLKYGIDIDTMPNAYQAANTIRQSETSNYVQNLANSMGLGSGHQYVTQRSMYDDPAQQQSMEQQVDPFGFGIGGKSQGFGIRKADWEKAMMKAQSMGISPEEFQKSPSKVLNMIAQQEIRSGTHNAYD
jgi:hypothetical protein